jgi:hypothetical protein
MKKLILLAFTLFWTITVFAQVNPNNHYVKGHYRTDPNHTNMDNYTTRPNTNPYTGEKGYIKPDNYDLPQTNYPSSEYFNSSDRLRLFDDNFESSFNSSSDIAINYHYRYSRENRRILELALQQLGYNIGYPDGEFDFFTISGIKNFQKNSGLKQDGKVGPNTLEKILEIIDQ